MRIWAISDLHLAFGVPSKSMEVFGPSWENYSKRIEKEWKGRIHQEDLVLIPGDISWGMTLEEALVDLRWIDSLPGTKMILKGNHDYWWPSSKKLKEALPPSIQFIHNNALFMKGVAIGGSRLWDTSEYQFHPYIIQQENPRGRPPLVVEEQEEKIFARELERLKLSLSQLSPEGAVRIAMTHYPPIGADLKESKASQILEEFRIDICVFGHLHNVRPGALCFGTARGVKYLFTSCDYLEFVPLIGLEM